MPSQGRKWFFVFLLALAPAWIASPSWSAEDGSLPDKAAVVNGAVIAQEDFENEMSRVQRIFLSRGTPLNDSQLPAIKMEVLENLIDRELLYQESQKKGIEIDPSAVDKQFSSLRDRFPSEAEFKNALSQMNLSETGVRSQIRRGMAIQQLIDEQFGAKVSVTEGETKTYYDSNPNRFKKPEEIRASHILIKVDPEADASGKKKARQKIEEIQEKLEQGEDFAALAKEFSEGPSAVRGGDLNFFRRGQMVKPFEDVAFALEPGKVSDIVETRFGYHLIKVAEKKPETTIAYKEVQGEIEEFLKREKVQEETGQHLEKLKKKADIKRFVEVEP
jgi:peptidyl-prolyl cis-trans isomerase C